ncbi:Rab5-interacting family protein [Haloarchaeobius salinus]|uniref:Rab5-interacting family protein n=1 Tax=Haloarchaeobius salinus TaxID=1198298 RepID=UPI0021092CF0|nr:Rab5-interacting family protein [Haloarchaeobius salinus]
MSRDDESRATWDATAGPPPRDDGVAPERRRETGADGSDRWVDRLGDPRYERRAAEPRDEAGMDPGIFDAGVVTFSLRYPFSEGGSAALLTGVLGILSFLVVPGVVAAGYVTRLAGAAARAEEPPGYDDIWGIAKCGLAVTVLWWGAVGGLGTLVYLSAGESVLLASVLALGGSYLLPGLFTTYAATEDLRAAAVRTPEFAFTRKYALHFFADSVLLVGLLVVGVFVLFLFTFATLLVPLAAMVPAAYWGYLYGEAIEEGLVEPLPPADA